MHWLRPRSKAPIARGWATAPVASLDELRASYRPGYNMGIRCGRWSIPAPGYWFVVIDFDIKVAEAGHEAFETWHRYYDGPLIEVLSGGGLGSRHAYFACRIDDLPPKANTVLAQSERFIERNGRRVREWMIEVLSTGKNVVAPPSIHPDTGRAYRWLTPLDGELPILPESILRAIAERDEPAKPAEAFAMATPPRRHACATGGSIADQFRAVPWNAILEPHGWQFVRQRGEWSHWVRPGKKAREGISASTIGDVFYPFTTSTDFEADRGYSKFHAYAVLEHAGDMSQAARQLRTLSRERSG